jgi:hypothetical protein
MEKRLADMTIAEWIAWQEEVGVREEWQRSWEEWHHYAMSVVEKLTQPRERSKFRRLLRKMLIF